MSDLKIEGRYPGTYEDYLDDSVRDPEAYGLTLEQATQAREEHYQGQGKEVPGVPELNPNLFAKLPSLAQLST